MATLAATDSQSTSFICHHRSFQMRWHSSQFFYAQNRKMDDDVKKSEQEEEEDGIRGGLAHAERIDGSTSPGHVCPNLNISHTH